MEKHAVSITVAKIYGDPAFDVRKGLKDSCCVVRSHAALRALLSGRKSSFFSTHLKLVIALLALLLTF